MIITPPLPSLVLLLMPSIFGFALSGFSPPRGGLRIELTHVDATTDPPKSPDSATDEIRAPVRHHGGSFLMDFAVGTPPVSISASIDTGSDLTWTQCKPCTECFDQPTPMFDPSNSSTFSEAACDDTLCGLLTGSNECAEGNDGPCKYEVMYEDTTWTQGVLARETFTIGSTRIPGLRFGCGYRTHTRHRKLGSGLVGLGRGPLSLTSQLGIVEFAYCFTSYPYAENNKSLLLLGSLARAKLHEDDGNDDEDADVKSTPILRNPSRPSLYYLNLTGITVGGTVLDIPESTFSIGKDGSGGVIIDSGTTYTLLREAAYEAVKEAFLSQVDLPVADGPGSGSELCFTWASVYLPANFPEIVLHFEGVDLELPQANYFSAGGLRLCLAIRRWTGMSVIGNYQQQNMKVVYDLKRERLSFLPGRHRCHP